MKASTRLSGGVAALLCVMFGAVCDPGEETGDRPESHVMVCDYDTFEAEITDGPSAGLRLEGHLMIFRDRPTGEFTGILRTPEGAEVFATGALYKSGDISLTFHTEAGYVMGLGRVGDSFCKEGAMIEGVAIGPTIAADNALESSDRGHWLLLQPNLLLDGGGYITDPLDPYGGLGGGFEFTKVSCKSDSIPVGGSCCKKGSVTACENGGQECTIDYGVSPPSKVCTMDGAIGDIVF